MLDVICFGFGAAAPGQTYPSIYIVGYVNNVYGIWQSTNKGQSWTQIGTQPAGELDQITTISGDPNVFGQVYVGFAGGGYAYLSAAPSVTSVTTNPASGVELPGDTITFTVNMSEAVTVSGGTPTLNLNDGAVATYVSGSGTSALTFTYTVSANDATVSALAISSTSLNGAVIQDSSGNAASLSGAVTSFPNLAIDPPYILSMTETPASGDLGVGKTVTFTLNISDPVTVSGGTPTLTLNDGGVATYSGGSGTSALTFSYTVKASDSSVSSLSATAVNLNGSTVKNSSGAAANFSISGVTQTGPQIDTITPAITTVTESPATGTLGVGQTVTFTVKLSDVVTVSGGTPTLTLNDGGVATYKSGSGSNTLTFSYTVASGQSTSALAASAVNLNGASIANGAGTTASLSLSGVTQSGPGDQRRHASDRLDCRFACVRRFGRGLEGDADGRIFDHGRCCRRRADADAERRRRGDLCQRLRHERADILLHSWRFRQQCFVAVGHGRQSQRLDNHERLGLHGESLNLRRHADGAADRHDYAGHNLPHGIAGDWLARRRADRDVHSETERRRDCHRRHAHPDPE